MRSNPFSERSNPFFYEIQPLFYEIQPFSCVQIRAMAAMAPVAFMNNAEGPIMSLAPYSDDLDVSIS